MATEKRGSYTFAEMEDAFQKRHTHANKALLDTYDQTNANIQDAVNKKHEHLNKVLLDTYTQTEADLADAVSKKHDHANKALLDTYDQTNVDITQAITDRHTHANKALLDTYTQTEVDLADAVSKKHDHANKATLDTITFNQAKFDQMDQSINEGIVYHGTDAVNTNTYAVTISGLTVVDTIRVNLRAYNANTGPATLNVNGGGAKAIVWEFNNERVAVTPSMISGVSELQFDSANDVWLLLTRDGVKESNEITQTSPIEQIGGTTYKDSVVEGVLPQNIIEGDSIVNSPKNPNFADTSEWSVNGSTISAVDNILSVTGDGSNLAPAVFQTTTIKPKQNTKAYRGLRFRVTNADALSLNFIVSDGVISYPITINNPEQNKWYSDETHVIDTITSLNPTQYQLSMSATYADAATANGKVMQVDGIHGVFGLDLTAQNKDTITADEIKNRYASNGFLVEGFNHAQGQLKVVGKNQFDKNGITPNTRFNGIGDNTQSATNSFVSGFIRVKGGVTYKKSPHIADSRNYVAYYDTNKNVIGDAIITDDILPTVDGYVRIGWYITSLDTAQLEIGTTATKREDYKESTYDYGELRAIGVNAETININTGEKQPLMTDDHTLQSAEISSLVTTFTNFDLVTTSAISFGNLVRQSDDSLKSGLLGVFDYRALDTDDAQAVRTWRVESTTGIGLRVAKGTFTNLADAQTRLNNTVIFGVKLTRPNTIQLDSAQFSAEKGGTFQDSSKVQSVKKYKVNENLTAVVNNTAEGLTELERKVDRIANDTTLAQEDIGVADAIIMNTEKEPLLREILYLVPKFSNTGATTIKVNDNNAVPLEKIDATGNDVALTSGDIVLNKPIQLMNRVDKYILI